MLKKLMGIVSIIYVGFTLYNMWLKKFWILPKEPFIFVIDTIIYGLIIGLVILKLFE